MSPFELWDYPKVPDMPYLPSMPGTPSACRNSEFDENVEMIDEIV